MARSILTGRRSLARGGADSTAFDIRAPRDERETTEIRRDALTGAFAIDRSARNASTSTISGAATLAPITNDTIVFNGAVAQDVPWGGGSFAAALDKAPKARAALDSFPPSAQRDYLEWISEAKQDATRAKRIATSIEWLSEGKRRHWKYQNC